MTGARPLVAAGLFVVSGVVLANPVRVFLERMEDAAHTLSYTGTFVYRHGPTLAAMHIVHRAADGHVTERLTTEDGRRQIIIGSRGRVTCYLPGEHKEFVARRAPSWRAFPAILPVHLKPLQRFYAWRLGGRARLAGRVARLLVIAPRDDYRYGYRLWADQKTGLLLKVSVVDDRSRRIEQLLFTHLRVRAHIPASAVGPIGAPPGNPYKLERSELFPDPQPTWTLRPGVPGFRLVTSLMRRSARHKGVVQHLVYSDGLAEVSVIIGRRRQAVAHAELLRLGALHVFRTMVGRRMVTALGDVPASTVERMALSVRRITPKVTPAMP